MRLSALWRGVSGIATRRSVSATAAVAVVTSAVVVGAVQSDGTQATNVQLNDGAVWVSNGRDQRVGRLNLRIDELDFAVYASASPDVLQDGRSVLFSGQQGVQRVDVVSGVTTGDNEIPLVDYRLGGGVGAVLDQATGNLWVGAADNIAAPDYPDKPDARVNPGSHLVVTQAVAVEGAVDRNGNSVERGRVLVIDGSGWYEVELGDDFEPLRPATEGESPASSVPATRTAPEPSPDSTAAAADQEPELLKEPVLHAWPTSLPTGIREVSSVGGQPIVLLDDGTIVLPDGTMVAAPGERARLQQPGPRSSYMLVASSSGLYEVALNGGEPVEVVASLGAPAQPVRVGSCVFGAWSSESPTYAKRCGETVTGPVELPNPNPTGDPIGGLVFRVNGPNVALNGIGRGDVWADHEGTLAWIGNWSDVEPNPDAQDVQTTTDESRTVVEKTCIDAPVAPIANDDLLGVRPRQSIIDVLTNDDDQNCEPIAISEISAPIPADAGDLAVIDNGQHILYSPSDAYVARGVDRQFTFTYVVSDIGGSASQPKTVTVNVRDYDVGNSPPALRPKGNDTTREMRAVVEEGKSVSYSVMADWWDPDGDDLRLVSALVRGEGEVAASPDGLVKFSAAGVSPGVHKVDVTISDGLVSTTQTMEVTVKPQGTPLSPVATNDFLAVAQGDTVTINPLANDSDPNEEPLSLKPGWTAAADPGYAATIQSDGATVTITGNAAGVYALPYEASDSSPAEAARATIRVEVLAPCEPNCAPIAVPDQVRLRANRVVNVDVLANDIDRDGDILGVTDVTVAASDGSSGVVRASLVDRRMVQVAVAPGPNGETPEGRFVISYQVTDGYGQARLDAGWTSQRAHADLLRARGAITIVVQPPTEDQAPVTVPDSGTVRVGDVTAVAVLRNDLDPDADEIELLEVSQPTNAAGGFAWVQGRDVFFQGLAEGTYDLQYSVQAGAKKAVGRVSFAVKAEPHPETNPNSAPTPPDLVVRAIAGGRVRVQVPWTAADPDGDSVTLLASLGAPEGAGTGNTVEIDPEDPQVIWYTAGSGSAPFDKFTYTVEDRFGLKGTGEVRVLVVDDGGWAPAAHDDVLIGRPGRVLSISVLDNDSSPHDRMLRLDALPFFGLDGQRTNTPVNADVRLLSQDDPANRGRIEVTVPTEQRTIVEHYQMTDGFNPSDAYIRVTPDENAPNLPPVAQTDVVTQQEVAGQDTVTVEVWRNDVDPDDAEFDLLLDLPTAQPTTEVDGPNLVVTLTETSQTVLYRVTDADGATAIGLVQVPGKENHPPVLSERGKDPNTRLIVAGSTDPLPISLTDVVVDPDGDGVAAGFGPITLTNTEVINVTGLGSVERNDDGLGFTYFPPLELAQTAYVTITFEVTDRPNLSVAARQEPLCKCLAQLSVDLVLEASSPPRVVSQGSIRVPQLDEEVALDLTPHVVDDQGDELTYDLEEGTFDGLTIEGSGPNLTIRSELAEAQKLAVGTTITVGYTVSDGTFDPVRNTFTVTIIATNKGQPAAATFPTAEAERDVTFTEIPNLVSAAVNPFASDGRPLRLLNPTVSGGATVACSETGDCTFLSNQVGTFTITYTLKDAVDQTATGTYTTLVKGKPRAPGTPTQQAVGDHEVTLAWTAADDQGAEITAYHVTVVETGADHTFTTTGGVVTGLDNAQTYHFTVVAENELGRGEVSNASSGMIPDRVPDQPEGLVFTDYQDRTLSLKWEPPSTADDFSAITRYQVQIGGQTFEVDGGVLTLTVGAGGGGDPLINGTDYTFRVRAKNSATSNGGWGEWSNASPTTERPSRYPDAPTNVAGANSGDGGSPRITVTWNAPASDGGRPLTDYRVCLTETGECQTVSAAVRTAAFPRARSTASTFTVIAINSDKNRAESDSATSPTVTAVGQPDAPSITSVTTGNHQLTVVASAANNSGCNASSTEYSINGGSTWQASPTFTGLDNGVQHTFVARTILASSCYQQYTSDNSNSMSGTPYGPLVAPTVGVSGGGTTTITWNWNLNAAANDDSGRPWTAARSGDCGSADITSQATGSVSRSYSRDGSTRSCTVTISASGASPVSNTASATVQSPPPPPSISVRNGNDRAGCGFSPCKYVEVLVSNFPANTALQVNCEGDSGWYNFGSTDGNGNRGWAQSVCYHGAGPGGNQIITIRGGGTQASATIAGL